MSRSGVVLFEDLKGQCRTCRYLSKRGNRLICARRGTPVGMNTQNCTLFTSKARNDD